MDSVIQWVQKNLKLIIPLGLVLVLGLTIFLVKNNVTNEGNKREQDLNAQYRSNYTKLSDCQVRAANAANVATAQKDAFNEIITNAVTGRYSGNSSAQVGSGQLFSAIKEAYPDLTQVGKTFQDVLAIVNGCRSDYQGYQEKLASMVASFNKWRTGSLTVRTLGKSFPNDNLEAMKGNQLLTGKAALAQMSVLVGTQDARDSYDTGVTDPKGPFESPTPQK